MLLSYHLKGGEIGDGYNTVFMYECKISNPERLDNWLLNNGYFRKPTIQESLSDYKVPELKEFLSKKGQKITGKKADLIERLIAVLSESEVLNFLKYDNRYFLSETGLKHYYDNIDLTELHRNWKYNIPIDEYFKFRKSGKSTQDFYETAYLVLKERIKKASADLSDPYRLKNLDFLYFAEICEKLELYEDATKSVLIKIYLDTNLFNTSISIFDKDMLEINGIDYMVDRIQGDVSFNLFTIRKFVSLKDFYSEYMIDEIYKTIKLDYIVFDKKNFVMAINDILQSAYFDSSPYMKIIIKNYRYIASKILNDKNVVSFSSILRLLRR